jgi:hypothetical protein
MEIVTIVMSAFLMGILTLVANAWLSKNELERKYLYELLKSEEKKNGKY